MKKNARAIALYLPQFHPIPENDEWWEKGFTEWANVTKANPLFKGHHQPHLPADLGFYDLRLPEVREAQADLARSYGIEGFCYYHYWFNGRRVLERPFQEVLESGKPDFPFCLCWANEDWTRTWDGRSRDVLLGQKYGPDDYREHAKWLAQVFLDKRYIRVNEKPLFLLYRNALLPDPGEFAAILREEVEAVGLPGVFLANVESFADCRQNPADIGFDAAVEFQPDWERLGPRLRRNFFSKVAARLGLSSSAYRKNSIFEYADVVDRMKRKEAPDYVRFPCVTPMWDNTARRKEGAVVLMNSTPEKYKEWLTFAVEKAPVLDDGSRLVFLNAWNEWAEGNHLEPCQKWGRQYLEATREALLDGQK